MQRRLRLVEKRHENENKNESKSGNEYLFIFEQMNDGIKI